MSPVPCTEPMLTGLVLHAGPAPTLTVALVAFRCASGRSLAIVPSPYQTVSPESVSSCAEPALVSGFGTSTIASGFPAAPRESSDPARRIGWLAGFPSQA